MGVTGGVVIVTGFSFTAGVGFSFLTGAGFSSAGFGLSSFFTILRPRFFPALLSGVSLIFSACLVFFVLSALALVFEVFSLLSFGFFSIFFAAVDLA